MFWVRVEGLGWVLIRRWVLINVLGFQGGRLFKVVVYLKVGAYSNRYSTHPLNLHQILLQHEMLFAATGRHKKTVCTFCTCFLGSKGAGRDTKLISASLSLFSTNSTLPHPLPMKILKC